MNTFFSILNSAWINFKIRIKVGMIYPFRSKYKKIKSIVPEGVQISNDIIVEKNVEISSSLKKIGSHVYIGKNTLIGHCSAIGSFSSIAYDVKIGVLNHPLDFVSTCPVFYAERRGWVEKNLFREGVKRMVEIGSDVLISANVVIVEGVNIGHGAVVAAGAVVTDDVAPYSIIAGVPAKLIRYRFDEAIISRLLESKWWELDDEKLKSLSKHFQNPDEFLKAL